MSLMFEPLRKYATFRGRARRKEFWLWQLFLFLLFVALYAWLFGALGDLQAATPEELEQMVRATPAARLPLAVIGLVGLGVLLPGLAVQVRRLHDSGKSGWWLLLGLTGIGGLVLLIFYLLDGTPGRNRHGPDPKGRG
ncbi:DUF805 domain-containing protein [Sandaracinobacter sp. RS1-74]|uniref:DUF805 domain-containing protein n=1 Tax=Sandaracinobacteroides sayramensis TaxID=2913411 RepID=UPI001EDAAAD6|nr:DUF805 domain-containing protein [Sandaracinobacteroides sayramensis]MCG2840345.1 DUF805 domain-containing protein [Sandaracinobacteroides sayramensis]